jgi:hypothetical protein
VLPAPAAAAVAEPRAGGSGHQRLINAVSQQFAAHPDDLVGRGRAVVEAGGSPVRFAVSGAADLSPEQAQLETVRQQNAAALAATTDIPLNAMESVTAYWSRYSDTDGEFLTLWGEWKFRGTYLDTFQWEPSAPYDAFALATEGVNAQCWKAYTDGGSTFFGSSGSQATNKLARKSAGPSSLVYSVDDRAGFPVQRGQIYLTYQRVGNCAGSWVSGGASYEHNKDGCNCTYGVSASLVGLGVSYSQNDPPKSQQWASGVQAVNTGSGGGGGSSSSGGAGAYFGGGTGSVFWGNALRVFARGTDGALWQYWFDGTWHTQEIGGQIVGNPSAVVHGSVLRVFARGTNGALFQAYYSGGTWTWQSLGGQITSGAGAVVWANAPRVFSRGTDGALYQAYYANGSWTWQKIGGQIVGTPSAVVSNGALRVFARGTDGALFQAYYAGGTWTWQRLGGQIA